MMNNYIKMIATVSAIVTILAGCSSQYDNTDRYNPDSELVRPIDPITGQPIQSDLFGQELQQSPINSDGVQDLGQEGQLPTQFIITEPTDKTPVTRQTMVGAWTVSALDESCQMFLALTKWTKGFRAASRGCSAPC